MRRLELPTFSWKWLIHVGEADPLCRLRVIAPATTLSSTILTVFINLAYLTMEVRSWLFMFLLTLAHSSPCSCYRRAGAAFYLGVRASEIPHTAGAGDSRNPSLQGRVRLEPAVHVDHTRRASDAG